MKPRVALRDLFAAASLIALCGVADAAPPAGFEQRVEQLRKDIGVPGVTIAIVEDGKVTLAHGWGVRDITTNQPVDADTIFFTGSTGKAFTNAALATLVDEGKIKWDDKVIDHMPDFRMWDPWVTREMTIRDLLVHRSGLGLGQGDLLFLPNSTLSRKETVRRIRYLKPATSFRSGYAYDNILYMAAGQLIEEVTGETWEKYLHGHVFGPLGMRNSTNTDKEFQASPNHARPHSRNDGPIHGLGTQAPLDEDATIAQNAAPAGGLAISANDMSRWLLTQLGRGKIPGGDKQLFSKEQSEQMWTGAVITPVPHYPAEFAVAQPHYELYALGWGLSDYRGAQLVGHDGAVLGSQATVALHRDEQRGWRDRPRAPVRAPRPLSRLSPGAVAREVAHLQDQSADGSCQAGSGIRSEAGQGWSLPAGRQLRRRVQRSLVRDDQGEPGGQGPDHQIPSLKRNGRLSDALSVRYLQDEPEAGLGRAGLRHLLDRSGRQGRPGDDEACLASGRFQLGLSGPSLHACCRSKVDASVGP